MQGEQIKKVKYSLHSDECYDQWLCGVVDFTATEQCCRYFHYCLLQTETISDNIIEQIILRVLRLA